MARLEQLWEVTVSESTPIAERVVDVVAQLRWLVDETADDDVYDRGVRFALLLAIEIIERELGVRR